MIYEFRSKGGVVIERDYPMAEAPSIGARIRVKGVVYRRIASFGQRGIVREERHLCNTLPRRGMDPAMDAAWHKWTDNGQGGQTAYCEGKRDRQELEARLASQPGYTSGYRYDQ